MFLQRTLRWYHKTHHCTKGSKAVAPGGDLCDFQIPKNFKGKTNKGLFTLKYEALNFVYKLITVSIMRCVSMRKQQQSYCRNLFLFYIA
jgi:hypothetical protein